MTFDNQETVEAYNRFLDVIKTLRAPGGCPWDREQTPLTMRGALIEEAYEAVDAITAEDPVHAKEELGDVLLNVEMISLMYEQNGDFSMAESINELTDKMIRRHPHVFGESEGKSQVQGTADDAEKVLAQWDRIKENVEGRKNKSVLDDVPESFPPLLRSYKLLKKAAKKGFQWPDIKGAESKVLEEWNEVRQAAEAGDPDNLEEEIGDMFLALVNYARFAGVNPEIALQRANRKFYDRFSFVETKMNENGFPMENTKESTERMINFWEAAKKK